jgi:hypothetical protein
MKSTGNDSWSISNGGLLLQDDVLTTIAIVEGEVPALQSSIDFAFESAVGQISEILLGEGHWGGDIENTLDEARLQDKSASSLAIVTLSLKLQHPV